MPIWNTLEAPGCAGQERLVKDEAVGTFQLLDLVNHRKRKTARRGPTVRCIESYLHRTINCNSLRGHPLLSDIRTVGTLLLCKYSKNKSTMAFLFPWSMPSHFHVSKTNTISKYLCDSKVKPISYHTSPAVSSFSKISAAAQVTLQYC